METKRGNNQFFQFTTKTKTEKISTFPNTAELPNDAKFESKLNKFETAQIKFDLLNKTKEVITNAHFPGSFSFKECSSVQRQPMLQPQPKIMQSLPPTMQNIPDERKID